MQEENWILKRISDSLKENGHLIESDLLLLRTQLKYRDEYLELLEKNSNNLSVLAYLFMKESGRLPELLETFRNRQVVKNYNFMTTEIKVINDLERELKNNEWCHHILVENNNHYQCVRCGVTVDENFHCRNYILLNNSDYDEGRKLYDEAVSRLEKSVSVTSIINEMLNIKSDNKVKQLIK